jgi:DnaJ-domain-containing protein 1
VRSYNAAWDYFAGMTGAQIEAHVRSATVWERPSWPLGEWRIREQKLREAVNREFFGGAATEESMAPVMPKAECDALTALGLTPPVNFAAIKTQYRKLVKKHHPDLHGGSAAAEEKFKAINQAFAVLRQIYATGEAGPV